MFSLYVLFSRGGVKLLCACVMATGVGEERRELFVLGCRERNLRRTKKEKKGLTPQRGPPFYSATEEEKHWNVPPPANSGSWVVVHVIGHWSGKLLRKMIASENLFDRQKKTHTHPHTWLDAMVLILLFFFKARESFCCVVVCVCVCVCGTSGGGTHTR